MENRKIMLNSLLLERTVSVDGTVDGAACVWGCTLGCKLD